MFLRLFKSIGLRGILLNIIIITLLWIGAFTQEYQSVSYFDETPMPLYKLLQNIARKPIQGTAISFILVLIVSFLVTYLNDSLFFIPARNYLPSFIYGFFSAFFVQYQRLNPVIPASIFLIYALKRIMDSYHKKGTAFSFFDASLLIGTGSLFYANLIWFGVIILVGVILIRGYNFKELALSAAGLVVPFVITAAVFYLFSIEPASLIESLHDNLFSGMPDHDFSSAESVVIIIASLSVITGIFFLLSRINGMKIKSREIFILLIWVFVLSIMLFLFSPCASAELIYLAAIPAVYFISYFLIYNKTKAIKEIMIAALFLSAVAIQILRYF